LKATITVCGLLATALAAPAAAQVDSGFDLSWNRIAGGGGTATGDGFQLSATIGQHEAGQLTGGDFTLNGGFWGIGATVNQPCYANCDGSTTPPILNVEDFICFINRFADATQLPQSQQLVHYANCDGSTTAPILNVEDFICFINRFAQGCL
jgi:hypothetical protein